MPRQPERGGSSGDLCWALAPSRCGPLPPAICCACGWPGWPCSSFGRAAAAALCGWGFLPQCSGAAGPRVRCRECRRCRQRRRPYTLLCALAHGDEESRHLSPLVARAVEAIRDNYMALYGVEELSTQLGVSKCHLVRVFSSEMGMPPGRFLTSVRIEAAKLLLAEREYSLEMIAGLCGFSGANYLCRVFKRETGLSPAAWRETAAHKAVVQKLPARNNEIYV